MTNITCREFMVCTAKFALDHKHQNVFRWNQMTRKSAQYKFTKLQTKIDKGIITIENEGVTLYVPQNEVIACEIGK